MVPANPRILIVKLSAIGDVLHSVPVLHALRRHFPNAHLGWVVEGRAADLLREHRALDRLHAVPRGWLKSISTIRQIRNELLEANYQLTIDLQCLARSAIMARLSGATVRIGFDGPDGREMSRWLHNYLVLPSATHVIERNLELLKPLGIQRPQVQFDLPAYEDAIPSIDKFIRTHNLHGKFAIINPGAGWPTKRWEMDRFAQVAVHLGKRWHLPTVVIWAGNDERTWAEQIVEASKGYALLAAATTLRELAVLTRRASLFVSADTGPLHLAAALDVPCVGLFGPVPAARNGPYGNGHVVVQKAAIVPGKFRRQGNNMEMQAIQVKDITVACDHILQRQARSHDRAS